VSRSRPRVLWLTNMYPRPDTGSFRGNFVARQLEALRTLDRADIDLEVVAQDKGRADYLLAAPRVRRLWREGHYDLLHVHYGLTGLATLLLPAGAPIVATLYGSDLNLGWSRGLTRRCLGRARRVIVVARRLAEHWPGNNVAVVPNGVDFEVCRPRPRAEACAALGLDPSRRWILFGASPDRAVKGYDVYREVVARVTAELPAASPLILTEPGQSYERVVEKLNAADVLLFTSRRGHEGSPTAVKEALAVGLPVVSVDVGDAREMLEGVVPGAVVDWPEDEAGRERWLDRLAAETLAILESGRRSDGREKRAFLREERIAERILEVYDRVLAGSDGP
jgi:glycosyltransferase involved in cell wall biosynthesis